MAEHLPIYTDLVLDQQHFTSAVNSIGMLMRHFGTRPWTFGDDASQLGNLDGFENLPGITDGTEVGRITNITGYSHGISYSLDFIMHNEIAGVQFHSEVPMVDMRVTATEGDALLPNGSVGNGVSVPLQGMLRGLIWLYPSRTTTVDFGHGTTASKNPESQSFLEEIVSYYGIDSENLFDDDANQGFVYDDERLKKLTEGLHKLMNSDL